MITLARSDDGVTLQLALEPDAPVPGTSAAGSATLQFSRLSAGSHRLLGDDVGLTFEADANGVGTVTVQLDGPVSLTLDGAA